MKKKLIILLTLCMLLNACTPVIPPEETGTNTTGADSTDVQTEKPTPKPPVELGEAIIALYCPVITNSCEGGTNQQLTDGDKDLGYSTIDKQNKDDPQRAYTVVIDLCSEQAITGIRLFKHNKLGASFPDSYIIEVSSDGKTYSKASEQTGCTAPDENGHTVKFNASCRYVRLTSTKLNKSGSHGYVLALGELEVLSVITDRQNLVLNKPAVVLHVGSADKLSAVYRLSEHKGDKALSFSSSDASLVAIDEKTGELTAKAEGSGILTVTDGANITECPFAVVGDSRNFTVTTFYLANHKDNSLEEMDLLKECGIDFIENCRPFDRYGNITDKYLLTMAADRGLLLSVANRVAEWEWLEKSEEEVISIVNSYKNLPGMGGIYILDEPSNANPFANLYKTMHKADPFMLPHMNLLPGVAEDYHGYVSDWCATVGRDNLQLLSYDNYPFGTSKGSFNSGVYNTLDEIRRTGLNYGVDTGYYLQGMGIEGAYRVPNEYELLYNASIGIAYGMKSYKWFVWFTPPYSGSGEHFITGILDENNQKSVIYDAVTSVNKKIKTLGQYLFSTDAVEVYHSDTKGANALPSDFIITPTAKASAIFTLFRDRNSQKQYVSVVNKSFKKDVTIPLNYNGTGTIYDITSGTRKEIKLTDGTFNAEIEAGGIMLIELPDNTVSEKPDTEPNLLLGLGADVSSSAGSSTYAYKLTDGKRLDGAWASANGEETSVISFDLGKVKSFNRLDVYPTGDKNIVGLFYPAQLTVWVSSDGVNYTKVAEASDIKMNALKPIRFDTQNSRYIKICVDKMKALTGKPYTEIGEIELYNDDGKLPDMEQFKISEPPAEGNKVLHMNAYVSSSYEEYGWTKNVLTDGSHKFVSGTHQGWCSMIGSPKADITEWVMFAFGNPTEISKVVIYPVYEADLFARDYHVEISVDGTSWTTVASVTGDLTRSLDPRILTFEPQSAQYVRFVVTKMGDKSSNAAIGYKVQISEIEIY